MKKTIIIGTLLLLATTITTKNALAIIHVGASIPISGGHNVIAYQNDEKASGIGLSATIPFGMMFRIDNLSIKGTLSPESFSSLNPGLTGLTSVSGGNNLDISATIYSIGYRFDFPLLPVHLAAAFGLGSATGKYDTINFEGVDSTSFEGTFDAEITASLTQLYLEAGYSFIPLFDVFIGIHSISGSDSKIKSKVNIAGTTAEVEGSPSEQLSLSAMSIGLNFGF